MWQRRGTRSLRAGSALLGAALGFAEPSQASAPSPTDVQVVAQAIERRGALLNAACGAAAGDALGAAAVQLEDAHGGQALAEAVTNAVRTIERADAASDACATAPPHLLGGTVQSMRDPARIAGAADRIRAWGEEEAAAAWARIAAAGAPDPAETGESDAHLEVCRCFGEAERGVRVVYGYPTPEMTAWLRSYELLGELQHGGCEVGSPLACPDGCWPDRQRPGDPPFPPREIAWHALGGLQVGVAGERATEAATPTRARAKASVKAGARAAGERRTVVPDWTPDPSAREALSACLGEHTLGRARRGADGVWAAWHANERDTCVAAWATAHVTETRIDRLAVLRTE